VIVISGRASADGTGRSGAAARSGVESGDFAGVGAGAEHATNK
jgi:hypothetical protein